MQKLIKDGLYVCIKTVSVSPDRHNFLLSSKYFKYLGDMKDGKHVGHTFLSIDTGKTHWDHGLDMDPDRFRLVSVEKPKLKDLI